MRRKTAVIIITALLAVSMSACGSKADKASAERDVKEIVLDTELQLADDTEAVEDTEQTVSGKLDADDVTVADAEADKQENGNSGSKNISSSSGNSGTAGKSSTTGSGTAGKSNTTGSGTAVNNAAESNTASNSGTSSAGSNTNTSHQGHTHNWVTHNATGHYETQTVKEAWDEPVYEYRLICNKCGKDVTDDEVAAIHYGFECDGSYSSKKVEVSTIHHDAVTEEVWVEEAYGYTECSICGERTININHNH